MTQAQRSNNNNHHNHHQNRSRMTDFRWRREALGLTRVELAAMAKCSVTSIYNIEGGATRRGISAEKIDRILSELEAA